MLQVVPQDLHRDLVNKFEHNSMNDEDQHNGHKLTGMRILHRPKVPVADPLTPIIAIGTSVPDFAPRIEHINRNSLGLANVVESLKAQIGQPGTHLHHH